MPHENNLKKYRKLFGYVRTIVYLCFVINQLKIKSYEKKTLLCCRKGTNTSW